MPHGHFRIPLAALRSTLRSWRGHAHLAFGDLGGVALPQLRAFLKACEGLESVVIELDDRALAIHYRGAGIRGHTRFWLAHPVAGERVVTIPLDGRPVPHPPELGRVKAALLAHGYTVELARTGADSFFGEVRDVLGGVVGDLSYRGWRDEPEPYAQGVSYAAHLFDPQRFPDRVLEVIQRTLASEP